MAKQIVTEAEVRALKDKWVRATSEERQQRAGELTKIIGAFDHKKFLAKYSDAPEPIETIAIKRAYVESSIVNFAEYHNPASLDRIHGEDYKPPAPAPKVA